MEETEEINHPNTTESTREQIIELAAKLFANKGYSAVGIQEIVNEAGISKPTLYYYFGSKKGLLESLIQTKCGKLLELMEEASAYEHDFVGGLTKMLKAHIQFAKAETDYFRLHCILINAPDDSEERKVYLPYIQKLRGMVINFFQQSTSEFGNMRGKEALFSTLFYSSLTSIAMQVGKGVIMDDDTVLYWIVHSFVYGVAN